MVHFYFYFFPKQEGVGISSNLQCLIMFKRHFYAFLLFFPSVFKILKFIYFFKFVIYICNAFLKEEPFLSTGYCFVHDMTCCVPAVWHFVSAVLYCSPVKKRSVSAQRLSGPEGWSFEFPVVSAGSLGPPSLPAVWHSGKNTHTYNVNLGVYLEV